MISLAEARALIAENISPLRAATAPLAGAGGRVLRQDVLAPEDLPAFDRSAMDGYAVAADDDAARFRVVAEIQPGAPPKMKIKRGECARIFTGAPIPAGASQVLMQENVRVEGSFIVPLERSRATHIRRRGEDARQGDLLLNSGTRLGAGELALLASLGVARPKVSPLVRVAHFATGNELVAPDKKLKPGQIRDSNSLLVAALVRPFGGEIVQQERVPDDFDWLLKRVRAVKNSFDLLLLSGGASVGDYDFGKKLLNVLGFKTHFTAVNLRPGKPLVFATRGSQAAFILPGNPVSHFVTLHVAVRLALEKLVAQASSLCVSGTKGEAHRQDACATTLLPLARIRLAEKFEAKPGARETFWPARVEIENGELVARPLHWQSSGDVTVLAGANALLQLPAGTEPPEAGEHISVLLLEAP
jgi:molybdopterin molybdotransferase